MSDMKCPICNDGKIITYLDGTYECDNPECSIYNGTHTETFETLIRTRKALEIAWNGLKKIGSGDIIEHSVVGHEDDNKIFIANKTLDESKTALEQKDVK